MAATAETAPACPVGRCVVVMVALGCLVPIVLIVAGAAAGGVIAGSHAALLGAIAGAVVGAVAMVGVLWGFDRIRDRGV